MDITTFARQLNDDFLCNQDELIAQFPERLETENGYEPMLDWGEYILDRINQTFPGLDTDATNEMLEEVRGELLV